MGYYVICATGIHYAKDCKFNDRDYPECKHYYAQAYEDNADLHEFETLQKYNIPYEHKTVCFLAGNDGSITSDKRLALRFASNDEALFHLWSIDNYWDTDEDGQPYYWVDYYEDY